MSISIGLYFQLEFVFATLLGVFWAVTVPSQAVFLRLCSSSNRGLLVKGRYHIWPNPQRPMSQTFP
jgi:hypothetical protein